MNFQLKNFQGLFIFTMLLFGIFSLAKSSEAADVTAASCSQSDVQTAVTNCLNGGGGTVTIPAGECTWSSSLSINTGITKDLRIIGAGQGSTVIHTFKLAAPNPAGSNLVELANMTIDCSGGCFTEMLRPAEKVDKELNWHHLTLTSNSSTFGGIEGWYGVIHHNTFNCASGQYGWYVHGDGSYPTSEPPTLALGTRNALFFEDNTFNGCYHSISGFCGASIVFRHNTVNSSTHCVDVHGPGYDQCFFPNTGTPPWRGYPWNTPSVYNGGRLFEHYNNTYSSSAACGAMLRSGSGISTGNNYQGQAGFEKFAIKIDGNSGSGGCTNCTHLYAYPCSNGVCQGLMQWWVWGESCSGGNCFGTEYDTCSGCLRENKEYYLRAPSQQLDGFTYTPYTYPHPLTLTGSGDTTPPSAPSGVTVN